MNYSINCCDLCGNVVSINGKQTRPIWHIKIEIVAWREVGTGRGYKQETVKHADIRKNVCDECQASVAIIGAGVQDWEKARTNINVAEITVKEVKGPI